MKQFISRNPWVYGALILVIFAQMEIRYSSNLLDHEVNQQTSIDKLVGGHLYIIDKIDTINAKLEKLCR